jgi:hypothetical protein
MLALAVLAATMGLSAQQLASAGDKPKPDKAAAPASDAGDKTLIASAMRAAPAAVAANAKVIESKADGSMRTVRAGKNGFTCMADNPSTPGPDPMCLDEAAMAWVGALMAHKNPPSGKVGFMYMLSGGTDASNTDPFATKPTTKNHWVKTGPHVMIVGADAGFYAMYPKQADPDTASPYVMWPGTPYQHLMIPVR